MLEKMTYETILEMMLSRLPEDVDKREGSIFYDALAPCAYALAQSFFQLEHFTDLVFLDTAVGEYLDRIGAMYGVERREATNSVWKVRVEGIVEIGSRFGYEDVTFFLSEKLSENEYLLECEQTGSKGNQVMEVEPLEHRETNVTLLLLLEKGYEEENDEDYRSRIYNRVQLPVTSGNTHHYKAWAKDIKECGDCKVFPLWNGAGTVKLVVVNENMEVSDTLPQKVKDYIETVRPIGADVTVISPNKKIIDVKASVSFDGSTNLENIKQFFIDELKDYIHSLTFKSNTVSYAKIGSILLTAPGVMDYTELTLNLETKNISLLEDEIAILGQVELEVLQ